MGQDKSTLPWGTTTVLQHLIENFQQAVKPLIIAGPVQTTPLPLPENVMVVSDLAPYQGPLTGFLNGLAHAPTYQAVFLAGCDFPFLSSGIVDTLHAHLNDVDAVMPEFQGVLQPLVGLYRPGVKERVQQLINQGARSMQALLKTMKVNVISEEQWQTFDPAGMMLTNINTPEEYQAAHHRYLASLTG